MTCSAKRSTARSPGDTPQRYTVPARKPTLAATDLRASPHQREPVDAVLRATKAGRGGLLLADDVGLGKTHAAWAAVRAMPASRRSTGTLLYPHRMEPLPPLAGVAAAATAGFALAHVVESAWHRFVAHGKQPDPTRTGHLEHHRLAAQGVDVAGELREHGGRGVLPAVAAGAVLAPVVGVGPAVALSAGLVVGVVVVNHTHARMHRRAPRGPWERWMWRFHWHHHAVDARVNFGLTNPLLDFVLGTAVVPDRVEVPSKLAPAWLRAADGEVAGIRVQPESAGGASDAAPGGTLENSR